MKTNELLENMNRAPNMRTIVYIYELALVGRLPLSICTNTNKTSEMDQYTTTTITNKKFYSHFQEASR